MALKRERFFAIFFALLFLLTSSFITIAFIIANYESSHNSNTTSNSNTTLQTNNSAPAKKLTNFTPISSVPALKIIDLKVGTGPVVKSSSTVTVLYTGAVAATGVIFQSTASSGKPVTFALNQVIPGWSQGLVGMKVGGIRRLLIPSALAYGANPPPGSGIPANADLVFDVTLLAIPKN